MKKQKNFQVAIIGVLAFAVLMMSVGFAAYAQVLNISGTATVAPNKWYVHFDDESLQLAQDSVGSVADITVQDTLTTFTVDLAKPGDRFAFSVDAVNDGTFNAVLNSITLSALTAEQAEYLRYYVVYDGTSYGATTSGINSALTVGASKTATVVVEYIQPDDFNKLPTDSAVSVSLTAALNYAQN